MALNPNYVSTDESGELPSGSITLPCKDPCIGVLPDGSLKVAVVSSASSPAATLSATTKTVAATATPERLAASSGVYKGSQLVIFPLRTNTGLVYLGTSSTNDAQHIETPIVLSAPDGKTIDAYDFYADVTVNGEGVAILVIA